MKCIRENIMFSYKRTTPFVLILALSLLVGACSRAALPPGTSSEPVTLKMALLPILDGLPMYVAQQEGYFESRGLNVEFITVGSAPERDQLISAGQADGMINEVVSTLFYNRDQVQVQIVRYARAAAPEGPLFSLLASGKSEIYSVEDLKGVGIGVSQGTVIEYLNDRLLLAEGLQNSDIQVIAVPKLDYRMTLLGSGELKAAMLPEPFASLAVQNGARVIVDDTLHPEYSYSTIAFRKEVIDRYPEAIRAFLAAVEDATQRINEDPERYNSLLSEQKLVPEPLLGAFHVPQFVTAGVPSEAQWNDSLAWAREEGLMDKDISYRDSVTAEYLP